MKIEGKDGENDKGKTEVRGGSGDGAIVGVGGKGTSKLLPPAATQLQPMVEAVFAVRGKLEGVDGKKKEGEKGKEVVSKGMFEGGLCLGSLGVGLCMACGLDCLCYLYYL